MKTAAEIIEDFKLKSLRFVYSEGQLDWLCAELGDRQRELEKENQQLAEENALLEIEVKNLRAGVALLEARPKLPSYDKAWNALTGAGFHQGTLDGKLEACLKELGARRELVKVLNY